jgi:serine/threonine protein kinase
MDNLNEDSLLPTEIASTTTPAGLNLVGSTLADRYFVERKLGEGGMGDVYLARDKPELMARQVVVKVLQEKVLNNEWIVTKFRQEIEALTRIDDPGVVGVLDAGTLPDGHPFLVMQFVEGENLRSHMRPDAGMDLEDIAYIMQQVGSTLRTAHANDVIHRDLKPENIMARRRADERWQVKVIDFGIAKVKYSLIAPSTVPGQVAGTAFYMAPEQLQGKTVTPASDVYSLGIIAYEMVTGRRPFNPETPYQLIELQQAGVQVGPKALRPALAPGAERAILKALSLQPGDRYQNTKEFTSDLAKALLDDQSRIKSSVDEETKARSLEMAVAPTLDQRPVPVVKPVSRGQSGGRERVYLLSAVAILLAVGLGGLAWKYLSAGSGPERGLTYWLTVQRMYDGKPLGQPFQSTGRDYFHTGDKFSLNFATSEPGALYLINQGRDEHGALEWNILFPTKTNNSGVARLSPQQIVTTGDYRFVGSTGVETIWVIWTTEPSPLLDSVIRDALEDGVIRTPASLADFMQQNQARPVEISYDEANSRASLKGRGDILVRRLDLSHKPN